MEDQWRAYVDEQVNVPPSAEGVLHGLTYAVKDVFNIKGYVSGAGNPDWKRTHPIPSKSHAKAIELLMHEGATLKGTTHTDELMYSLNGENYYFGTPINPKVPERIPGGSSSGSAVAVAAGLVDFALGTDTGGSVRIPSSYCGIYGFRPTHGVVPIEGVIPLAKSFDTVGWMTQTMERLVQVGRVLIRGGSKDHVIKRIIIPEDVLELIDLEFRQITNEKIDQIKEHVDKVESVRLASGGLGEWLETFRVLQGAEIWETHGAWIEKYNPTFGPGIRERFEWTKSITEAEVQGALEKQKDIQKRMQDILQDDGVVIMPTAPSSAPMLNTDGEALDSFRQRLLRMTSIAGLSGLPQVTLPLVNKDGMPIGISIIANRKSDLGLLAWTEQILNKIEKVRGG
ncbi:amidase [Aquibacillus koreensis]|uniref:Amidase n=1 Tax=Aquibacillus koreensis TaxID=279446 RepID=A0A9X3WSF5_9BACI|nr:amidase [Aquibacillus koreensis]MCT2534187.1 amidase [Aquibacillus koreensis]MDC3422579.1 amidase [Aquibacillus koreensis]